MALLSGLPGRLEPLLRNRQRELSNGSRTTAHVRMLSADRARVRTDLSGDYRKLAARGSDACVGMAIDLHARHAALSAHALRAHERIRDVDYGTVRHGEGTGGAGNRTITLRTVRRPAAGVWR